MRKIYLLLLLFPLLAIAQPAANYYSAAVGKSDAALKTQLYSIIENHTERTYSNLWTDFRTTDKKADGKVWDMYSNCTFTFGTNQDSGSGGSAECQFYNREHSFPKSWFKDGTPMYSDLFHLYPTDKFVNNQRGNLPFGETNNPTDVYANGSKRGTSTFSGYSGVVFEPINEYKGDFARSYFYMVTAYENVVNTWSTSNTEASPHLNSTKYPAFNSWTVDLLLKWHRQDPVSSKETNRNNAVSGIQKNRNPYIDYPELAEHIWGTKKGIPWSLTSGIDELKISFSISPNPVQSVLNIKSDEANLHYTIFNLNGQTLIQDDLNGRTSISTEQLENGMYLLQLSSGQRKSIQKFIVNK